MSRYGNQYGNERGYGDRYDRFTNYNSPRDQPSGYPSDMYYDDHYGGSRGRSNERAPYDNRRGNGGGGHSGSRYDRDVPQPNYGKEDRRSGNRGGFSQIGSSGLLGASPNEPLPAPANPGNALSNTTQQQVLAAIQAQQTQNLLVALQAQQLSNLGPGSLLPTPAQSQQRGKGQGRQYADKNRQRTPQPKRRSFMQEQGPMNKRKRDDNQYGSNRSADQPARVPWKQFRQQPQKQEVSSVKEEKQKKAEGEEDDVYEIIDEEQEQLGEAEAIENVEIAPELIEKVEELRKRTKVDRNIADQDVDKLATFSFDGQTYRCELCKIVARKFKSIKQHLMGKKHSLNVIEARQAGNDVNRDVMDIMLHPENWLQLNPVAETILKKQTLGFMEAKRKEEEEYRFKHPENFVTYRIDTRKSAVKHGDLTVITSACEANVAIKEFASDKQMFGCEFIKAATGFHCRLCDVYFNTGASVIEHIKSEQHTSNYQKHLETHEGYHDKLVQRNKEIVKMLEQHEGEEVVMYETFEEDNEKQKNIQKKYIKRYDPSFLHVEKEVNEEEIGEEANEEENLGENEDVYKKNATEDEELNFLGSGQDELVGDEAYDEEDIKTEPPPDDYAETDDIGNQGDKKNVSLGQAESEKQENSQSDGNELYEPSEPTFEETESEPKEPTIWEEPKKTEEEVKVVKESTLKPKTATRLPASVVSPKPSTTAKTTSNQGSVKKSGNPNAAKNMTMKPQLAKMSGRGRSPRGGARSARGGRMTPKGRVAKSKPTVAVHEESFEVIDEVGAGEDE